MDRSTLFRLALVTTSSSLGGCFDKNDEAGFQPFATGDAGDEDGPADDPAGGEPGTSSGGAEPGDADAGPETTCGNAVVDPGEECDDGNDVDTDDCLTTCVTNVCGDGFVHAELEECDDGNLDNTDDCLEGCSLARCGDGIVHAGVEECDDANVTDDDECVSTCLWNVCGDGAVLTGLEECDNGEANGPTGACLANCALATCGDGLPCVDADCVTGPDEGPEQCDDGNDDNQDDCIADCAAAACGDGFLQLGVEECDGANLAGQSCFTMGFGGGALTCSAPGCQLDESNCCLGEGDGPCTSDADCCDSYASCISSGATYVCSYGGSYY